MQRPHDKFIDTLVRYRFRSSRDIQSLLDKEQQQQRRRLRQRAAFRQPRYIKGVYNGQFFRIPIPEKRPLLPSLPKVPQTIGQPKPFSIPTTASGGKSSSLTTAATVESVGLATTPAAPGSAASILQQTTQQGARSAENAKERVKDFFSDLREWWKENWAVLVLNIGSIATLWGFTRSDVVELRALSATGSITSIVYHFSLTPRRYVPMAWSLLFTTVNAAKIAQVLHEREGVVNMTKEQESVYARFFMPHGVTPKQFELLWQKAEIRRVPKGQTFIREGLEMTHVSLVTQGETRAQSTLGRRLTAASFKPSDQNGGDRGGRGGIALDEEDDRMSWTSGAWIGEIAFLEKYWRRHKNDSPSAAEIRRTESQIDMDHEPRDLDFTIVKHRHGVSESEQPPKKVQAPSPPQQRRFMSRRRSLALTRSTAMSSSKAHYNIVAVQDSVVMRWKHEDMEALMAKSHDMRGAMTRAMTAAIVGKVINFTVSTSQEPNRRMREPHWTSWLGDWTNTNNNISKEQVQVRVEKHGSDQHPLKQQQAPMDTDSEESPAGGPVKKFG